MAKKKKVEKIGTIDKMIVFNAEKPKFNTSFRCGKYLTDKDRPRKKVNKRDLDKFL